MKHISNIYIYTYEQHFITNVTRQEKNKYHHLAQDLLSFYEEQHQLQSLDAFSEWPPQGGPTLLWLEYNLYHVCRFLREQEMER
jgi:hypothetical protein